MRFDVDAWTVRDGRAIGGRIESDAALVALVGRSGAGKTTLLDMIAGLTRPARGHVRLGGETLFDGTVDVPPERRRLGYVFQDARLFPHRRVRWNLLYGHARAAPDHRWMTPAEAIAFLGLEALLDRWPRTLSGGEAQRVAIGRALLAGPRALLLDEPLRALDPARREEVVRVIERVRDELGLPILLVSHDAREVERLQGHVIPVGDD